MTITHASASKAILAAVDAKTLTQGGWRRRGDDGREIACLLGSIDPSVNSPKDCNGDLMPMWMAELTPVLFDGVAFDQVYPIAQRYGTLVGKWHVLTKESWDNSLNKFLVRLIDDAVDSARPVNVGKAYWPQVEQACSDVKTALGTKDKDKIKAARAAADAAARAARAAADAARAARAASKKLFDFLLDCIETEIGSLQ
jgi:hypothetical protein